MSTIGKDAANAIFRGKDFVFPKIFWTEEDGRYQPAQPVIPVDLPPGIYMASYDQMKGPYLHKMNISSDIIYDLSGGAVEFVLAELDRFWKLRDKFRKRGFLHKRGVLMTGAPGTGKTAALGLIAKRIAEQDGLALYVENRGIAAACLEIIRAIEPDRRVAVFIEDLDEYDEGDDFLALMDGERQVDNIVFIATTNHPEKLSQRVMDRPSRFDLVIEIEVPGPDVRRQYLQMVEPSLVGKELDEWVKASKGLPFAHLKELVILCRCFEMPLEEGLARIQGQRAKAKALAKTTESTLPPAPPHGWIGVPTGTVEAVAMAAQNAR